MTDCIEYTRSILWNRSMSLAERVFSLADRLPAQERYGLRSQMTRAATSIPSNVAEGWVRSSWREKVRFLSIAHGSLAELNTQLLLAGRLNWLSPEEMAEPLKIADEIGRMLTVLKRRWRLPDER